MTVVAGRTVCVLAALLLWPLVMSVAESTSADQVAQAVTPANLAAAIAVYRRQLDAYTSARTAFDEVAASYRTAIAEKRSTRNAKRRDRQRILLEDYVLSQPPVYAGPPEPIDPSVPSASRLASSAFSRRISAAS